MSTRLVSTPHSTCQSSRRCVLTFFTCFHVDLCCNYRRGMRHLLPCCAHARTMRPSCPADLLPLPKSKDLSCMLIFIVYIDLNCLNVSHRLHDFALLGCITPEEISDSTPSHSGTLSKSNESRLQCCLVS